MNKIKMTVIVLTYNESKHIRRCIESVINLVSDVVVVDSYSTDDTVSIAQELGARVFQNKWINYATQFQWALDNIEKNTEWIMRLDADEYLEQNNIEEFFRIESFNQDITGVVINRKYYFMGKWMRFGAMHPIAHLKIWRNGFGVIENRWMDERIMLFSGSAVTINISIVDDNLNDLSWWISKHNAYSSREMVDILNQKYGFLNDVEQTGISGSNQSSLKRFVKLHLYSKIPLFIRPILYFVYRYIVRLGFLDGTKGFMFHFMHALWYRILVDAKVYEISKLISGVSSRAEIKRIISNRTNLEL